MMKRIVMIAAAGILTVGFSATSVLAFHCPKLIGAGRRLAAKSNSPNKAKAIALLDEALALHKSKEHKTSMQKATQAVDLLTK